MDLTKYENVLFGEKFIPALNGGHLDVYRRDNLLKIVKIPAPNLLIDDEIGSMVENYEEFFDEDGNLYGVGVESSISKIKWKFLKYPKDENILKELRVEVKYN